MSVTYEIVPYIAEPISFRELLATSERHINRFLSDFAISGRVTLLAERLNGETREPADHDFVADITDDDLLFISVDGVLGGVSITTEPSSDRFAKAADRWWRFDEIHLASAYVDDFEPILARAKEVDRIWTVDRTFGQPPIIHLAFGMIAATLADIEKGLVYSGNPVWGFELLPMIGSQLHQTHFRPDMHVEEAGWAESCINKMRNSFV